MSYAKEDLTAIRNKVDIVAYLEKRGLTFRESGVSWVGLCPIHSERSPSFHVKPAQQTFRCYGCGVSGDIFSLVQELEQLSFPGAVQLLAEEAGVELKLDDDPNFKHRQQLLTINRLAAEWYRYHYMNIGIEHPAKQNLVARKLYEFSISDESVGFAPAGGLLPLLKEKGFTDAELIAAGIVTQNEDTKVLRERFRNRLIWTIYDIQGRPIGFSARKIFDNDMAAKYINSPQTEIYNKSKALLGLSSAKRAISQLQKVYVVEGQTDVMALKAVGKTNAVASCGTAFGVEHANMLFNLSKLGKDADKFNIVFCFDGDVAGVNAAKKVFNNIPNLHLNAYVVKLTGLNGEATDPCDFRLNYGDDALNNFIDKTQVSLVEFILAEERTEWDITSPEGKSNYITSALKILDEVKDGIQYAAYLRKVAEWTGISYTELQNWAARNRKPNYEKHNQPILVEKITVDIEGASQQEIAVLAAIIQFPEQSLALVDQLHLDESFFPTTKNIATKIISDVKNNNIDLSDKQIIQLSHYNLIIADNRKDEAVNFLFKQYMQHLYQIKNVELENKMFNDNSLTPEILFAQLQIEQELLKQKYLKQF